MPRTRSRIVSSFAAVTVGVCAVGARALDVPIPATTAMVKPAKLAKLVAKAAIPLPAAGSSEDPTLHGAELTIFDTDIIGAGRVTFFLGAPGWKGLGTPAGQKGYRYKGKDDGGGPCSSVLLKSSGMKAVCKGAAVTLSPPFSATVGVSLGLPGGTTAAVRYCAELGGTEKKNDDTAMKRVGALAPALCPELPSPFRPTDVIELADDALQGRNNNTPGSAAARELLLGWLAEFAQGLDGSQSGDAAFLQPFVQNSQIGTNVLAVIPGSELPNEYVMVGAHYDHLGSCRVVTPGDTVCNGATDNAAGVAVAVAVGRGIAALPMRPRRSVIVALWDAEEDGLRGSQYYVGHPVVPLASTVAYVNLDIQGANLLPSLRRFTFAVGSETGAGLPALVAEATAAADLDYRQLSFIFGQGRSDYVNLVNNGVPTVFFSDSTGPCYHTNADEVGVVDFTKLEQQARRAYELTLALANAGAPPSFVAPSPALATFADAVTLDEVLTAGLADLALFNPTDQTRLLQIQAEIHAMVLDGPANFDSSDVLTLLLDTIDVVNLLTQTACDGFF